MPRPRLNIARLTEAAEELGDKNRYQIHLRTGVPQNTLSRLWRGQAEPRWSTVQRIAAPYAIKPEELLTNDDEEEAAA